MVTHAGLTHAAWQELGSPVSAATAADLYLPWLGHPAPFGQIHGHSTIVHFGRKVWTCGERIRQRATVDWPARHTFTRIGTTRFIGSWHDSVEAGWRPIDLRGTASKSERPGCRVAR